MPNNLESVQKRVRERVRILPHGNRLKPNDTCDGVLGAVIRDKMTGERETIMCLTCGLEGVIANGMRVPDIKR